MSVKYLILLIQVNSIEIHIKFCRAPKIMNVVPKFKLAFSLHGKHLVTPVHGILLGLMASFLWIKLRL
jgi:hypothetical protein